MEDQPNPIMITFQCNRPMRAEMDWPADVVIISPDIDRMHFQTLCEHLRGTVCTADSEEIDCPYLVVKKYRVMEEGK
jgi:hypothetical protein